MEVVTPPRAMTGAREGRGGLRGDNVTSWTERDSYPTEVEVQVCVARSSTFVSGTPLVEFPPPAMYHRDPTSTPACPARAAGVHP
eukprot:1182474-Prorocentrum_minimum.AAC.3